MPLKILHKRSVTDSKRPIPSVMEFGELSVNYANGEPGVFLKTPNNSVIKIGPAFVGTNAPNNAPAVGGQSGNSVGEFWFDENVDALKIWDGVAWRLASLGGNQVIVATTAPTVRLDGSVLVEGDLWWECDEGGLYIWYIDSGSNQWVQINGSSGGTGGGGTVTEASLVIISETAPIQRPSSDPLEPGDIWWQSDTGSIAVWYNDGNSLQWVQFNANLVGMFVEKTSDTGSAVLPSGNISQRDGSPEAGYTRWNTDLECLEVFDGDAWICLNEDAPLPVSLGSLFVAAGTTAELPKETSLVYDSITVENTGTLISNNAYSEIRVLGNVNISGTLEIRPVIKGGDSPGNGSRTGPSALSLVLEGRPGLGLGVGNSDNQGVVYGPELQPYGSSGGSSRVAFNAQGGVANAIGGRGGDAAGGIDFICDNFFLAATGAIIADGTSGTLGSGSGNYQITGASGGSGGYLGVTANISLTTTAGGTISVNGGNGSNAINSFGANKAYSGGGGGGGGYVRFTSPTIINNATITGTGGANGTNAIGGTPVVSTGNGFAGGSFAGIGGYQRENTPFTAPYYTSLPSGNGNLSLTGVISTL